MTGAAFPSPMAEMAEMSRLQYELDYTEGISQSMRIPEMLKVAPQGREDPHLGSQEVPHSVIMQVPERIVMSGDGNDPQYPRPRDLDLIQATPLESLSLKTPPRVLTLSDRPLDFLEEEEPTAPDGEEALATQAPVRRRSASEVASRHGSQLSRHDSAAPPGPAAPPTHLCPSSEDERGLLSFLQSTTRRAYQQVLEVLDENPRSHASVRGASASSCNPPHDSRLVMSSYETSLEAGADDMTVVDATTLRRQLIKLNRRLQHLEEESKERSRRELLLYSATVAFWLLNTWVWLRR